MGDESSMVFEEPEGLDYSFSGGSRLHTAADFSRVFAARRSLRGEFFDLHYLMLQPEQVLAGRGADVRMGLVVAKKLARRAVLRNVLKRLAREAFRHTRNGLPSCDLVFRLARPPLRSPQQKQQDSTLRHAWRTDIDRLLTRLSEISRKEGLRS